METPLHGFYTTCICFLVQEKTGSSKGAAILKEWDKYLPLFWQLVPPSEEDTPEACANFDQTATGEVTLQSAQDMAGLVEDGPCMRKLATYNSANMHLYRTLSPYLLEWNHHCWPHAKDLSQCHQQLYRIFEIMQVLGCPNLRLHFLRF